jgi:hypothetical protein
VVGSAMFEEDVTEDRGPRAKTNGHADGPFSLIRGDALQPEVVQWLWYSRIPAGQITLIGGKGGSCKGLIMASLAASYRAQRHGHTTACRPPTARCSGARPRTRSRRSLHPA